MSLTLGTASRPAALDVAHRWCHRHGRRDRLDAHVGMAAMRSAAIHHYHAGLVILSVVVAITFSTLAAWLAFTFRNAGTRDRCFGELGETEVEDLHPIVFGSAKLYF